MEIQEVLTHLNNVKGGPSQFTAKCPSHDDNTNSLSIGTGRDGRILLHCHAGCSLQSILDKINMRQQDLFLPSPAQENGFTRAPRGHGETGLQKCKNDDFCEVIYPYRALDYSILFEVVRQNSPNGGKSFRQRRPTDEGYAYNLHGVNPVLYRLPELRKEIVSGKSTVYLCEGEKDADRLAGLGLVATTAPMGAGKWRDSYTSSLRGAARVVILPDHDLPGRRHAVTVAASLQDEGIEAQIVDLASLCPQLPEKGDVSDVLDLLGDAVVSRFDEFALSPGDFEARYAQAEQQDDCYQFEPAAVFARSCLLQAVKEQTGKRGIGTGFSALDRQLDGHLYPGLYVVGSVSSLGKTAFCLQMADHIAAAGQDVLFFTLEMSKTEMVARSLVRQLFADSKFTSPYSVGSLLYGCVPANELETALGRYETGAGRRLAFLEGGERGTTVADVTTLSLRHKKATGESPVVFVDYLQILRSEDPRLSDKQAMDQAVTALKRLSRELDAPVISVSSFNRQNYSESVNLSSFKESGAIEYSADFVLGLQARGVSLSTDPKIDEKKAARMVTAATVEAKKKDPRPLEAVTLKNRRGPAWESFPLDFYPKQNFFVEGN